MGVEVGAIWKCDVAGCEEEAFCEDTPYGLLKPDDWRIYEINGSHVVLCAKHTEALTRWFNNFIEGQSLDLFSCVEAHEHSE